MLCVMSKGFSNVVGQYPNDVERAGWGGVITSDVGRVALQARIDLEGVLWCRVCGVIWTL